MITIQRKTPLPTSAGVHDIRYPPNHARPEEIIGKEHKIEMSTMNASS